MNNNPETDQHSAHYNERSFWRKLRRFASKLGQKAVYMALLLYYAYRRPETPAWAKRIVLGALGYLILPLDFVPDLTPILGYTDDIGAMSLALVTVAAYVNEGVRSKARQQLRTWFGNTDDAALDAVDAQL